MWWYEVKYYGGNWTKVRAPGIEEALAMTIRNGRVVMIKEIHDSEDQDAC